MSLHTALYIDSLDHRCPNGDQYRLMRWQCQGNTCPVVVALPIRGTIQPPDRHSGQLANLALRSLCGFTPGFLYYEVSRCGADNRCFLVTFGQIGSPLRPVLVEPSYRPVKIESLRRALGDEFLAEEW
jgi:hypothetical protein